MESELNESPRPIRGEVALRLGGHVAVSGPDTRRVLGGLRLLAGHIGRRRDGVEQPSPAIRLNRPL